MPDDKRTFDAQTLNIKPIHPRGKASKESGIKNKKTNDLSERRYSFSKDIILRLIDWLEKE